MAVSETNHMSHDMILPCCDEGTKVFAYHEGWRSKLELEPNGVVGRVASRRSSARCSDDWRERQDGFGLVTFGAGADRGHDEHDCKFRAREVLEARKTVNPAGRVRGQAWELRCLLSDSKSGTVGRATDGLRRAREDATRRIAMHIGKQCS